MEKCDLDTWGSCAPWSCRAPRLLLCGCVPRGRLFLRRPLRSLHGHQGEATPLPLQARVRDQTCHFHPRPFGQCVSGSQIAPKCSHFEQICIISQSLRVKDLHMARPVPVAPGLSGSCAELSLGCSLIQSFDRGRVLFRLPPSARHHRVPVGCWPEAALSNLPHGPLQRASHHMAAGFSQGK